MKTLLADYRTTFREQALDLLWRQWIAMGVAGHGAAWQGAPIDPEALLLSTCTMARYDARLFDAMLEWMAVNGRYINVQRLTRMLSNEAFCGARVFGAIAAVTRDSVSSAKWACSSDAPCDHEAPVPLFRLSDGRAMPLVGEADNLFREYGFLRDRYALRQVVGVFRPEPVSNLHLKLRALFGVNARSEIIAFLLVNGRGSPRSMARDTYYTAVTVTKALSEMRDSGYVISRMEGRRRYHKFVPDTWRELLLGGRRPIWIAWPRLLRAIEEIWNFLGDDDLDEKSPLAQASALRRLLLGSTVEKLDTSLPDFAFGNPLAYPAETLIPFFTARITDLFGQLNSKHSVNPD